MSKNINGIQRKGKYKLNLKSPLKYSNKISLIIFQTKALKKILKKSPKRIPIKPQIIN